MTFDLKSNNYNVLTLITRVFILKQYLYKYLSNKYVKIFL